MYWQVVDCDGGCINGTQTRTYAVATEPLYGGAACPDVEEAVCTDCGGTCEHRPCATADSFVADDTITTCSAECCKHAPVDCVGQWSAWGPCSGDCKCNGQCRDGVREQSYWVITQATFGGSVCEETDNSVRSEVCDCTCECSFIPCQVCISSLITCR